MLRLVQGILAPVLRNGIGSLPGAHVGFSRAFPNRPPLSRGRGGDASHGTPSQFHRGLAIARFLPFAGPVTPASSALSLTPRYPSGPSSHITSSGEPYPLSTLLSPHGFSWENTHHPHPLGVTC